MILKSTTLFINFNFDFNDNYEVSLDKWIRSDYIIAVESRSPKFITFNELQKIMEWKLARGKNRPMLKGILKRNTAEGVKNVSMWVY